MLKIILFVVSLFIITSCQEEEKRTSVDVKTLLSDWVTLTEMDGKQVIFNSCDGGNSITSIVTINKKYYIVLHGTQEDDFLLIKDAYRRDSDTIYFTTTYRGNKVENTQKFILLDNAKQLAYWKYQFLDSEFDHLTVNSKNQSEFESIEQPCIECFDEETCLELARKDSIDKNVPPIQRIKEIFDAYVEFEEGTDSEENKRTAKEAFSKIDKVEAYEDFEILLNFWMYYDPTDFSIREELMDILNKNKPQSIEAIKTRLKNKRENEVEEYAPYLDLKHMLQNIENN